MRKFIAVLVLFLLASPAWCADQWDKTRPAITDQWTAWPAASQANNKSIDRMLANYREGMTLSYSSATTIAVSAGEVMCSNSDGSVRKMRQNTSAVNVTFADIDTGAEASSTTYYLYAVADADATTATFKISASSTAPTGITYYKRLGSFYNDASSNITDGSIINDNKDIYIDSTKLHLGTKTLTNGFLGKTTTGTTLFNNGTNVTCPTGCYITGGIKQSDSNFTYFNYACP